MEELFNTTFKKGRSTRIIECQYLEKYSVPVYKIEQKVFGLFGFKWKFVEKIYHEDRLDIATRFESLAFFKQEEAENFVSEQDCNLKKYSVVANIKHFYFKQ